MNGMQRVEQLRALVATAKHDDRIPLSVELHVLRNIAKILEVDLDGP